MRLLLALFFLLFVHSHIAQNLIPKLDWIHSLSANNNAMGIGIATDNSGNVIITGSFWNTVDFDPSSAVSNLTSAGGSDIFVAKYTNDGLFIWAKSVGGALNDEGKDVKVDHNNNIVFIGLFRGSGDFNPGVGVNTLVSGNIGFGNTSIVKLDSLGNHIWSKALSSTSPSLANQIAIDSLNQIYILGRFENTLDLDPGTGISTVFSSGDSDLFLIKLNSNGNYLTGIRQGGNTFDEGNDIVFSNNHVYIAGRFSDTVDFDPSISSYALVGQATYNAFVEKLDANLNFQWVNAVEGSSTSEIGGISVNQFGQLYVSGSFTGTVDLDPGFGTQMATSNGGLDIYLIRLDVDGNFYWAKNYGGDSYDGSSGISCDIDGNPYLIGPFIGTVDFDPGPGVEIHSSEGLLPGYHDLWVEKFDTLGNMQWVYTAGNVSGINSVSDIYIGSDSRIYMTGFNEGTIDWAPGAEIVLLNSPSVDAYIQVFDQCEAGISFDTIAACNNYTWINGTTYTFDDSTSVFTILNGASNGCDSLIVLKLKMNYTSYSNDFQTICDDNFTWLDGINYTTNTNSPTWTIPSSSGCDSIISLNLNLVSIDPTVTQLGDLTIGANAPGAQYQWLYCDSNYAYVVNETNQTITPSQNGSYAVQINLNGCIDTSECITISSVGLINNNFDNQVLVFPNPTNGPLFLSLGKEHPSIRLNVYDADGKKVRSNLFSEISTLKIDLHGDSGLYIIEISAEETKALFKVVKK